MPMSGASEDCGCAPPECQHVSVIEQVRRIATAATSAAVGFD
jgi:hypothetical protein